MSPETPRPDPPAKTSRSQALNGIKVLIVDDHEDTRDVLCLFLERAGAQTVCAADVSAALAALRDWMPAVVVTDISMPEADGFELLRQFREVLPEVPVLALSGHAGVTMRERVMAAGFAALLTKPVDPAIVLERISFFASR